MATGGKPKKKNPRLASGRKRVRQDVKLNAANTSLRSKYRTAVKNVEKAVVAGDKTKAAAPWGALQQKVKNRLRAVFSWAGGFDAINTPPALRLSVAHFRSGAWAQHGL